jgi:alkylation response protein AidB-like acyl-CoA dehydrogenase
MNSVPPAEWMIITAVTDVSRGVEGVSAFILERSMSGLLRKATLRSKGRSDPASERLVLRDVVVPEANMVGEEGQGLRSARRVLEAGRIYWAAASLGLAEAALETGFGLGEAKNIPVKAPDSRGRIQSALAERIIDLQAAKIQVYRAALMNDRGLDTTRETYSAAARAADLVLKSVGFRGRLQLKAGLPRNTAVEFKRGAAAVERWRIIEKILAND